MRRPATIVLLLGSNFGLMKRKASHFGDGTTVHIIKHRLGQAVDAMLSWRESFTTASDSVDGRLSSPVRAGTVAKTFIFISDDVRKLSNTVLAHLDEIHMFPGVHPERNFEFVFGMQDISAMDRHVLNFLCSLPCEYQHMQQSKFNELRKKYVTQRCEFAWVNHEAAVFSLRT